MAITVWVECFKSASMCKWYTVAVKWMIYIVMNNWKLYRIVCSLYVDGLCKENDSKILQNSQCKMLSVALILSWIYHKRLWYMVLWNKLWLSNSWFLCGAVSTCGTGGAHLNIRKHPAPAWTNQRIKTVQVNCEQSLVLTLGILRDGDT